MRLEINREMRRKIIIYSVSLASGILLFTVINNLDTVLDVFASAVSILAPFLFGLAFAVILNKPMMWIEGLLMKTGRLKEKTCRIWASLCCILLLLAFLVVLVGTAIPSLIESLQQFIKNFNTYSRTLTLYIEEISKVFSLSSQDVEVITSSLDWFPSFSSAVSQFLPRLAEAGMDVARFMMDLFISIAATFYLLLDKDQLLVMAKKVTYSFINRGSADYLSLYMKDVQQVFEQYIVSNLMDSTIVGLICWIFLMLMKFPYAPMIGFIIGITNIIPVFGPFLGAVPVVLILLLIKPWYALVFAIFILVLQQVDGNVLKPVIMGDRLGISGFWILFSVTVGGSLFGIVGMFLGVPVFALIYAGIRDLAEFRLANKRLSIGSDHKVVEHD